ILAMLERQGRELFLECAERVVKAGFDHVPGNLARLAVRRESPRGIAKHIARELIEQENEGKRALRALGPVEIFARRRLFKIRKEAVANFRIERRVLLEPDGARLAVIGVIFGEKPEIENFLSAVHNSYPSIRETHHRPATFASSWPESIGMWKM